MTAIRYPIDYLADLAGRPNENGTVKFGVAGQDPDTNPIVVYWDAALTQVATQPLTMTAGYIVHSGSRAQVYTSASSWSMRTRDSAGSQIDYFPTVSAPPTTADLASTASGLGASLVGKEGGGTVQDTLGLIGTHGFGALAAGASSGVAINYTFSGEAGGTSDFRAWAFLSQLEGANSVQQIVTGAFQAEARHTAGTLTFFYGIQGFNRLGRDNIVENTGDVTTCRGVEWHIANESNAAIGEASVFLAQDVDMEPTTSGTIDRLVGFRVGNLGHATRVLTSTYGVQVGDFTQGCPITASYGSDMSNGTGKWHMRFAGSANSAIAGNVRIGDTTVPTDRLEINGHLKAMRGGVKQATGTYHELVTDQPDYCTVISNTNVTSPYVLRLFMSAAAPNNTTVQFMECRDNAAQRMIVWSNGNIVNANNSYGAISDERLKTVVGPAPSVMDNFRKREFFNAFYNNDPDKTIHRVILAQRELEISPELVSDTGDHLEYNYAGLALQAGQGVSELIEIIDDLLKRVARLEGA